MPNLIWFPFYSFLSLSFPLLQKIIRLPRADHSAPANLAPIQFASDFSATRVHKSVAHELRIQSVSIE